MINSSPKHLPYLDGWRGLAILGLLAGHFFPVAGINLGTLGVNFFFVLSGLLMGRILFIDKVPLATFYRRRIARIFPLAYFFIGAIILWWGLRYEPIVWKEVLAAAAFINNYVRNDTTVMPFGHFWSLCVEEHAYVVLSLVALSVRWVKARTAIGIALLTIMAIGTVYTLTYHGPDLYHELWLHSEVSVFGIFVSAFILLSLQGKQASKVPLFVIAALLGLGIASHWWRFSPLVRTFVGVTALALAVNLLDRSSPVVRSILSFRPLRQLGVWSFSIYIWQQPFYSAVDAHHLSSLSGLGFALLTGIASFYLIEQPSRAWLNRYWYQPSRPSAVIKPRVQVQLVDQ